MTAGLPCACASATACAMTVWMSASVRNELAFAQKPLQPESGVVCGGGDVPALLIELLPPPQPVNASGAASASQTSLFFRIAPSPQARIRIATRRNGDAPTDFRRGGQSESFAGLPLGAREPASGIIAQPSKI
jgi:xanthine/CO dehydrogenase XdhC/CoxF family maturation factor